MNELQVARLEAASERIEAVRKEVNRVFIGPSETVDHMMVALLAGGHVLLEGVPGVAKTTLAKAFAGAIGVGLKRVQFTPDLLPADITGTYVLNPKDGSFAFRRGPVFAQVVLADEINRAPPKTQAALLEAMQEQQVTVEGESFALPKPFIVVATQNPIELEGTYPLPEAQVDRFLMHLVIGYPSPEQEVAMLTAHHAGPQIANPVLEAAAVLQMQELVRQTHVEADLYDYAVALTGQTRRDRRVALGASPRATLGLVQVAKAAAVVSGRAYVTPDDMRQYAAPVLAHRLVLHEDVELLNDARRDVIRQALEKVSYRKAVRPA